MEKKRILVTSALPYVNNVPHLGNIIGCVLSGDVFARFNRSVGNETLYICGTDEHGTATEAKAVEEGLTPKQICDKYYKIHKEIYEWFNMSFDIFGRTSRKEHISITQDIFLKLHKNGYTVEEEVEQLFCNDCRKFLADRFVEGTCPFCGYDGARGDQCDNCSKLLTPLELISPRCKIHGSAPVVKKTRHLFIDLTKLQSKLEAWVKRQSIKGRWTQNAITTTKAWLKQGLEKRAITRDLKWGVNVPLKGFEDKVFYVWFDAPIGYISITAELTKHWKDWWQNPSNVKLYQFMAKDNIPFHTIVFPATLIATKQKYTLLHHINSTEYLQYEAGKFSKSRNIGVFGDDAINSGIPADAYRYYLLINRPENSDAVFTWSEFGKRINNELVANLGNFVNRTLSFIDRFQDGKVMAGKLDADGKKFWGKIKKLEKKVTQQLENVELRAALKSIFEISQAGNRFFQSCEPWKTIKEDPKRCERSLFLLANIVKDLAILIEPYLPATSESIFTQLGVIRKVWGDLGNLSIKEQKTTKPKILFEKIDDKTLKEFHNKFGGTKAKKEVSGFSLLNLKVGRIIDVKKHPNADKLFIERVDVGDKEIQIVSGLAGHYTEKELIGKKVIVVANLEEAKLRGEKSEGMLLAAEKGKDVGVLYVDDAKPGAQVLVKSAAPNIAIISFNDFLNVKMEVIDGIATCDGEKLYAGGEQVKAEKVKEGNIL